MPPTLSFEKFEAETGREIGVSSWIVVDQAMIDTFAEATGDRQFIHLDSVRAAQTPFGGTVAHGFLTLSLLPRMAGEALPVVEGRAISINYGFDKVRFVAPVRSGARVRARFVLRDIGKRGPREVLARYGVTVEIEGEEKPALAAEWLTLAILEQGPAARA
jgi:acyl dehydratase